MKAILAIALGGSIGAVLRHLMSMGSEKLLGAAFPYGALSVNVLGSLAIGILLEMSALKWNLSLEMRYFLVTGVLGAFTTFSTFSLDVFKLFENGQSMTAAVYILASVLLSLSAIFGGVYLMRGVLA